MTYWLQLSLIISLGMSTLVAHAQCYDEEVIESDAPKNSIYIIDATFNTNLISLDEDSPEYIYIAVKKDDQEGRFKLNLQQGDTSRLVTISLQDREKLGSAKINYKIDSALSTINFGGEITLTESEFIRMDGGGTSQMNQSTTIFHNQEVVIYRIHLKSFTIEPVFNQYAYFHFPTGYGHAPFNITFQPASAGLYLKKDYAKDRKARIGITAGPNVELRPGPNHSVYSDILGIVNLKFAVDL